MSISNTSGNILLIQFFPILNEFGYAFDEFRPILHGVKLTKLWIPIWEQKFLILVLILYEYTIIRASIRKYAQKLELHSWDTINSYIDLDCCTLICPTKWSTPFNMYDLMKALKFGTFLIICRIIGIWSKSIYDKATDTFIHIQKYKAQQAFHMAHLATKNDSNFVIILVTPNQNWYHNLHSHANPFPDSHIITHFKHDTITYDEPIILPELQIELRTINPKYTTNVLLLI